MSCSTIVDNFVGILLIAHKGIPFNIGWTPTALGFHNHKIRRTITMPQDSNTEIDLSQFKVYVGTFTKQNGEVRTMKFRAHPHKVVVALQDETSEVVYDLEADNFRRFNFGSRVGRVVPV
jgi:hypothetical protein